MANKFFADPSGGNFFQGNFFEDVAVPQLFTTHVLAAAAAICVSAWWIQPVYSATPYTTSVEEGPIPVVGTTKVQQFASIYGRWIYTPEPKQPRYTQINSYGSSVDAPPVIGTDGRIDIVNLWQPDWGSQRAHVFTEGHADDPPPRNNAQFNQQVVREWIVTWGSQKAHVFTEQGATVESVDNPPRYSTLLRQITPEAWKVTWNAQRAHVYTPAYIPDNPQPFNRGWLNAIFPQWEITWDSQRNGPYVTESGATVESVDNPPRYSTLLRQITPEAWKVTWNSQRAHFYTPAYVPDNPQPFNRGWLNAILPQWEITWDSQRNGPYVTESGATVVVTPTYPGVSFTPGPAGWDKKPRRKVVIGDQVYEVENLRDVEFLLKRLVRQEAEPITKAAKAKVVVAKVATKVESQPTQTAESAVEVDWSALREQLAMQDKAYARILESVLQKQEEDDLEAILLMWG